MDEQPTDGIVRRNRPGTKAKDLNSWENQDIDDMDSTLAVHQYIQQMVRKNPKDLKAILDLPESQNPVVWQYEHMRQFCMELSDLAVLLTEECDADSCPQMKATDDWEYRCAAHAAAQDCSAISYTMHTLDGASALLNSEKQFPSRVNIDESKVHQLQMTARRVYRIFAHAFFHHKRIFDEFEASRALCQRFHQFCMLFEVMEDTLLIVPQTAFAQ